MPTLRGQDGIVATGGVLLGTAVLADDAPIGAEIIDVAAPAGDTLVGGVSLGQAFTIDGLAGTYQVAGLAAYRAVVNSALLGLPVTPPLAAAMPAGGVLHFDLPAFAPLRRWQLTYSAQGLRTTVCRQDAETYRPGLIEWIGAAQGLFDYRDAAQQALLDALLDGGTVAFLTLGNVRDTSSRPFWVNQSALILSAVTTSPLADLVDVVFSFRSREEPPAVDPFTLMWEAPWETQTPGTLVIVWAASWDGPPLPALVDIYHALWET